MINKKFALPIFLALAFVQLYVPAKMIFDKEDVINSGTEYKFKTAPIDPNDPFRGKYLTLSFRENSIDVSLEENWLGGETVFVLLASDEGGFAKIQSISKQRPLLQSDFIVAKVRYVSNNQTSKQVTIDYPFDRYYMEESKAYAAEKMYREAVRDRNSTAYALVSIKDGDAVLKDLLVDGISLKEMVKSQSDKNL